MASASDLQEQDLTFYDTIHHSLITTPKSLSLIVHDPTNEPSWLISGIIQQGLSETNECYLSPQSPNFQKPSSQVIFVTFLNTESTYSKSFSKLSVSNNSNFKLISFLDPKINEKVKLENWFDFISKQISENTKNDSVLILENPSILLDLIPGLTNDKFLSQLQSLQSLSCLYITISSNLSYNSIILPQLLHRSSLIVSLTALETGRADDISGILSISNGPVLFSDDKRKLNLREYSYLVTTNSVKLYYK